MARRIVHHIVDDIDGNQLEIGEGETILFSLDGIAYEIDLSDVNAAALRDAFAPYISAGRKTPRAASNAPARKRTQAEHHDLGAVRTWAKEKGMPVSERGRISATVMEAYAAAH